MNKVIIIGDSTHNTLSAVRSFGEAKLAQKLILVCHEDTCNVRYSKYLRDGNVFLVHDLDGCMPILEKLACEKGQFLMTTFDAAAEWVDCREIYLSKLFKTPCRGAQIGNLFHKDAQCLLAKECGLEVPFSIVYNRDSELPLSKLIFPLITKPLVSSAGAKEDIHICHNLKELLKAFQENSSCKCFLLQQFIEKEYEINCLGLSTGNGVVFAGGIQKYRHWPVVVGAGSYAKIQDVKKYGIDVEAISEFLKKSHYHGPFSVEFLHTPDGNNYFMEVNFRNDGLAYTATCAGANLHALYVDSSYRINWSKFRETYMMNYSIDLLYVKKGSLSFWQWLKDLFRTRCFINICFSDLNPVLMYYKQKLFRK